MHIPVGTRTSVAVIERGTFACPRCKHWQRAEVIGHGLGVASLIAADGTSRERARWNASKDGARTLRFATCPRCKQRSGHAAFIAPYVCAAIAVIVIALVFSVAAPVALKLDWDVDERAAFHVWFPLIVAAIVGVVVPWTLVAKWRGTDRRVRWLDF